MQAQPTLSKFKQLEFAVCFSLPFSSVFFSNNFHPEFHKTLDIQQRDQQTANAALISYGYLGCSPQEPTTAFTLETLEFYHQIRRQQPSFSTQAMAKVLCALNDVRCNF
jgi:CxC1 like cysteine cluster associated with KDZ transposases